MNNEGRKERLKEELRERIKVIQFDIARLESQIILATDEKKIHEEDLQFHIELLDELGGFESEEEEEELSVENINQVESTGANQGENQAVGITGATDGIKTPGEQKPKKEDIQEARDKARAWHLDRKREKEKKKTK
jgi:hypothetical protein